MAKTNTNSIFDIIEVIIWVPDEDTPDRITQEAYAELQADIEKLVRNRIPEKWDVSIR